MHKWKVSQFRKKKVTCRPNVRQILGGVRKLSIEKKIPKVGVFTCGPQPFMKSISDSAYDLSDSQVDFELHEETFFL